MEIPYVDLIINNYRQLPHNYRLVALHPEYVKKFLFFSPGLITGSLRYVLIIWFKQKDGDAKRLVVLSF